MKELARGIKINIIGNLFRFSRAGFVFAAVGLYGPAKFGVYTVAWTTVELVILFGTLGVDQGLLFELAHFKNSGQETQLYRKIASTLKACFALTSFAVAVLLIYVHSWVDVPSLRETFFILLPVLPFYTTSLVLLKAIMGLKEMKYNAVVRSALEPVFLLIGVLIFWKSPWADKGIVLAQLFSLLATSFLCIQVFGKYFSWSKVLKALKGRGGYHGVFRYSLPIYLIDTVDNLLYRADIFLITAFLGTGTPGQQKLLGVYGLAKQIARVANQTKKAFGPIFISVTSESFLGKEKNALVAQAKYSMEKLILLNGAMALFLILFGKELLDLLGKDPSLVSRATFIWLLVPQIVYSSSSLLMYFLITTKSARRLLFLNLVIMVLSIGLGVFTIPRWGILGASFSIGIAYLLISFLTIGETIRLHGETFFTVRIIRILLAGFAAALFIFFLEQVVPSTWNRWGGMMAAFLPGLALYFLFTLKRFSFKKFSRVPLSLKGRGLGRGRGDPGC